MSIEQHDSEKFRSRKWIGMIVISLVATVLLVTDNIESESWTDVIKWVYGLFAGANVASLGIKKINDNK